MSNVDFDNLNYEQFEVSANNDMYKSPKSKIKREKKEYLKINFKRQDY